MDKEYMCVLLTWPHSFAVHKINVGLGVTVAKYIWNL
jgi:hypothetical protein